MAERPAVQVPAAAPAAGIQAAEDEREGIANADLKIILLGDSAVGKSKLVERYLMDNYHPRQRSTYALTLYRHEEDVEEAEGDAASSSLLSSSSTSPSSSAAAASSSSSSSAAAAAAATAAEAGGAGEASEGAAAGEGGGAGASAAGSGGGGRKRKRRVAVDFWDTAGQERFASMHASYYYRAHACVLVFDVTRKVTYTNLQAWYKELRQFCPHIPCICIANKIDVDYAVTNKAFAFPGKHGLPFFFVSAADGTNVVAIFQEAVRLAWAYKTRGEKDFVEEVLELIDDKALGAFGKALYGPHSPPKAGEEDKGSSGGGGGGSSSGGGVS